MHGIGIPYTMATAVIAVSVLMGACTLPATDAPEPTGTQVQAVTPTQTPVSTRTPSPTATLPAEPHALPVTVVRDVLYLEPLQASVRQRYLDIYVPDASGGGSKPYPVVVFAHGYNQGKAALTSVCEDMASQGLVVLTPNWRTDPSTAESWREMTESLMCAVRFARATASSHGGDPDNVALVGFSMGAGVGALVATNGPNLEALWSDYAAEHNGPPAQTRCVIDGVPAKVHAFVGIGGAYSLAEQFQSERPDLYALLTTLGGATDLPIALMHGEFDSTVPLSVSEEFQAQLIAAGFAPTLITYNSGHTVPRALTVSTVVDIAR